MINYRHKDRLFHKLFGEDRKNLLSLYNAVNGTQYVNENELTINTIEDVIYMGMKNDVSCIFDSRMSVYEHQSTWNPNMPLRGFLYFAKLYDKFLSVNEKNIYSKKLVKLPAPQYYVFYNGTDEHADRTVLKMSDAFEVKPKEGLFEWTAVMLNVNYGRNKELLEHCKVLKEYAIFNDWIRRFLREGYPIEDAVKRAVDRSIQENVLREFLTAHKAEVIDVILTEYDEEAVMSAIRREERAEGREEGREEGRASLIKAMLERGTTPDQIAAMSGISLEEIQRAGLSRN